MAKAYISTNLANSIVFAVLIVVLLVKPAGLLGKSATEKCEVAGMTQKMNKFNSLKKTTKVDFATYLGVIVVFIITTILQNNGSLKRSAIGLLVPICCYMPMAVSLNLTVGISVS